MKSAITSHLPSARWMMTDCSFLLSSNPFMNNVGCNELDNARHNRSGKSRVTQRLPALLTAFPMSSELSQFQSSLPSPAYLPAFATVPPIIGLAFVPRYFFLQEPATRVTGGNAPRTQGRLNPRSTRRALVARDLVPPPSV